ncbi:unnamed protein product [Linum tenue]|uniref:Uncharacterized protein n=1 Tax=Linum tenue TaxID=586396 RepID=A0AAV0REC0_9ROSI|nr:unnamed protein product [Linum tenue]
MGFEEFEPIYCEPKAEWGKSSDFGRSAAPLRRFMMHVFAPDYYHLKIQATDYSSNTFEANKSITQLEDLQDSIGIGGSWSEFVDYFISSLESEDVKLVLEKHSGGDGAASARLVSQKTKGMPLISISLRRVLDCDAKDVMADISFGLFKTLKCPPKMTRQGQGEGYSSQLMKGVATDEKTSNQLEILQHQRKLSIALCQHIAGDAEDDNEES